MFAGLVEKAISTPGTGGGCTGRSHIWISRAISRSRFITTRSATSSISKSDDNVDVSTTPIAYGTLYTFCPAGLIGDEKQGGTAGMQDGDTLLLGFDPVLLGSSQDFMPFTLFNNCAGAFTYTIEGPSADEYSIDPAE